MKIERLKDVLNKLQEMGYNSVLEINYVDLSDYNFTVVKTNSTIPEYIRFDDASCSFKIPTTKIEKLYEIENSENS